MEVGKQGARTRASLPCLCGRCARVVWSTHSTHHHSPRLRLKALLPRLGAQLLDTTCPHCSEMQARPEVTAQSAGLDSCPGNSPDFGVHWPHGACPSFLCLPASVTLPLDSVYHSTVFLPHSALGNAASWTLACFQTQGTHYTDQHVTQADTCLCLAQRDCPYPPPLLPQLPLPCSCELLNSRPPPLPSTITHKGCP